MTGYCGKATGQSGDAIRIACLRIAYMPSHMPKSITCRFFTAISAFPTVCCDASAAHHLATKPPYEACGHKVRAHASSFCCYLTISYTMRSLHCALETSAGPPC